MGRTTTAKKVTEDLNETPEVKTVVAQEVEQPLNLEQQVTVRSIAGWQTGFKRLLTVGDVTIPKKGVIRLSRNEIISQVHDNNNLFCGIDGKGNHATFIVDDDATLREINFEDAIQFGDDKVKKLFSISDQRTFEDELKRLIVTRAEKYALMVSIHEQNLNDFSKIRFCEAYTGYKMDSIEQDDIR